MPRHRDWPCHCQRPLRSLCRSLRLCRSPRLRSRRLLCRRRPCHRRRCLCRRRRRRRLYHHWGHACDLHLRRRHRCHRCRRRCCLPLAPLLLTPEVMVMLGVRARTRATFRVRVGVREGYSRRVCLPLLRPHLLLLLHLLAAFCAGTWPCASPASAAEPLWPLAQQVMLRTWDAKGETLQRRHPALRTARCSTWVVAPLAPASAADERCEDAHASVSFRVKMGQRRGGERTIARLRAC